MAKWYDCLYSMEAGNQIYCDKYDEIMNKNDCLNCDKYVSVQDTLEENENETNN